MQRFRFSALGAVAFALALAATTANATDFCEGRGSVLDVAGAAYVTNDCFLGPSHCLPWPSFWVYVESNGERGLQRGGANLLGDEDVCQDSKNPDTAVF